MLEHSFEHPSNLENVYFPPKTTNICEHFWQNHSFAVQLECSNISLNIHIILKIWRIFIFRASQPTFANIFSKITAALSDDWKLLPVLWETFWHSNKAIFNIRTSVNNNRNHLCLMIRMQNQKHSKVCLKNSEHKREVSRKRQTFSKASDWHSNKAIFNIHTSVNNNRNHLR